MRSIDRIDVALRLDDTTTSNVIYIGYAPTGSAETDPVWQIQRLSTATGLSMTWADGNPNMDNIWDNRATTVVYA